MRVMLFLQIINTGICRIFKQMIVVNVATVAHVAVYVSIYSCPYCVLLQVRPTIACKLTAATCGWVSILGKFTV